MGGPLELRASPPMLDGHESGDCSAALLNRILEQAGGRGIVRKRIGSLCLVSAFGEWSRGGHKDSEVVVGVVA